MLNVTRYSSLSHFVHSYRPNFPVNELIQLLAFDKKDQCEEWMAPFNLVFADSQRTIIDCKTSANVSLPLIV